MKNKDWLYFIPHISPILIICGYALNMPWTFLGIFFISIGLLTILDFFTPRDESYSYQQLIATPENDGRLAPWLYEFATATFLLLHLIAFGMGLYFIQFKEPFIAWLVYAYLIGYSGSTVLTVCHEYYHHNSLLEKMISRFFLSLVFFNAYESDHLQTHHDENYICTDKDHSHAKLNESVYAFTQKYLGSTFKAAIELQRKVCEKEGFSFYNIFKNTLLKWTIFSILLPILVFIFIGWKALIFYLLHAYISIIIHLYGSYNQHYGLTRRKDEEGRYESFTYMNTWVSDHFLTGKLYFNISHHGHHHLFSFCRYPYLKVCRLGPTLPYGYNAIFIISMFPRIWYKLMNPRVEEVFRMRDQYEKEGNL